MKRDKEKYINSLIETYTSIINKNKDILKSENYYLPDWKWFELKKEMEIYQFVIKNLKKIYER